MNTFASGGYPSTPNEETYRTRRKEGRRREKSVQLLFVVVDTNKSDFGPIRFNAPVTLSSYQYTRAGPQVRIHHSLLALKIVVATLAYEFRAQTIIHLQ